MMDNSQIRQLLEQSRMQHGALTPHVVVEDAKHPQHPLHDQFEWDNSIAGQKYRLEQARNLIQRVKVIVPTSDDPQAELRQYVSVKRTEGGSSERDRVYVPVEEVLEDPISRRILLLELERELARLQKQFGHLSEFAELLEATAKKSA